MEWQPIETAPKDGTRILAYLGKGYGVYEISWSDDCWFTADGEWTIGATHWMPLPDPPTEETEA